MIPKHIFLIWLGDNIPNYVFFSLNAYQNINKKFKVELIHIPLLYINNNYINFKYSNELQSSIYHILNYENSIYKQFIISQLTELYIKNVRFIQLLSDIFRLEIINKYGGIYVDCDTYPIKPFDEKLLQKSFIVTNYFNIGYNNINTLFINKYDNYFLGSNINNKIIDLNDSILYKICQSNKNYQSDIGFRYRKKLFFQQKLTNDIFNYKISNNVKQYYIEHYNDNNWKSINYQLIRTQLCKYDEILKNDKYNISVLQHIK